MSTLVEKLIALAIVCSALGVVGYFVVDCACRSNTKEAEIGVRSIRDLVNAYRLDPSNHRLPDSLDDLTRGEAPLTKKVPRDPWGNDYVYEKRSPTAFRVVGLGPDGTYGTEDDLVADGDLRIR